MEKCGILDALKYIEDLHKQIPSKEWKSKNAVGRLFNEFNKDRVDLQRAAGFAGAKPLTVYKASEPISFDPEPAPKKEPKDSNPDNVQVGKKTISGIDVYFYKKGSDALKGVLAFSRTDPDTGQSYVVMQSDIKKDDVVDYIKGGSGSTTSIQKKVVSDYMSMEFGIDLVNRLELMSDLEARKFIMKHEFSHILNADRNTYYNDKNQSIAESVGVADDKNKFLADSAVRHEAAANIDALFYDLRDIASGKTREEFKKVVNEEYLPWEGPNFITGDVSPAEPKKASTKTSGEYSGAQTSNSSYSINGKWKTNQGQRAAIVKMKEWYKNTKEGNFLLQGRGGTGKTTVINVLLDELGVRPDEVVFSASTSKAKKVLEQANKGTAYKDNDYYTVPQLLKIIPVVDKKGKEQFVVDHKKKDISLKGIKLLVVDEASTLNPEDYRMLNEKARKSRTRIVYIGDSAQPPPVSYFVRSPVFGSDKSTVSNLTELMRQGEDSPIQKVSLDMAQTALTIEESLMDKSVWSMELSAFLDSKEIDGNDYGQFDASSNEGVIVTDQSMDKIVESFVEDYNRDPKGTKIVNFNSPTHTNSIARTEAIRRKLFGDEKASSEAFIKGEPIILNGSYTISDSVILDNGEEFTVVSSTLEEKHVPYSTLTEVRVSQNPIRVYSILAKDNITGEEYQFTKFAGNEVEMENEVKKEIQSLRGKVGNPKVGYQLPMGLGSMISHGYVVNGHKAQGISYTNVYLDVGNFLSNKVAGANSLAKGMYAGASKARKKLVIVDSRGKGNVVTNPNPLVIVPASLENIDNGQLNSIINSYSKKCEG